MDFAASSASSCAPPAVTSAPTMRSLSPAGREAVCARFKQAVSHSGVAKVDYLCTGGCRKDLLIVVLQLTKLNMLDGLFTN